MGRVTWKWPRGSPQTWGSVGTHGQSGSHGFSFAGPDALSGMDDTHPTAVRQVAAQVTDEPGLIAEDQRADIGVKPIGSHHEIESAWLASLERNENAFLDASADRFGMDCPCENAS